MPHRSSGQTASDSTRSIRRNTNRTAPATTRSAATRNAPPTILRAADALSLQRSAGNRAACSLLAPPAPVIQRAIENQSFKAGISDEDKALAEAFFAAYRDAVDRAYTFAVSVPSLGAMGQLNGHTKKWTEKWASFLAGWRPLLMAASFGYVIESLVTEDTPFRPNPPASCSVVPQVTVGGTRPDLVLRKKGGGDIAWLDLTASGSVDHIYSKEGWDAKIGTFAEVTYPSLGGDTLALMAENRDNTGTLSKEEFEDRRKKAQQVYQRRKDHWVAMGRERYSVTANSESIKRLGRLVAQLDPAKKQQLIRAKLETDFGVTSLDIKMVPSILRAMGVNPASWDFGTGFSESLRAGEAWLVDHDPGLPPEQEPAPEPVAEEDKHPLTTAIKGAASKYAGRFKPY